MNMRTQLANRYPGDYAFREDMPLRFEGSLPTAVLVRHPHLIFPVSASLAPLAKCRDGSHL